MQQKKVLIAGCGYVGRALARGLVARGDRVWALSRRADESEATEGIIPFAADLEAPETLKGLPTDLDAMVYAAAAGAPDPERYRAIYVEGLRNLLDALGASARRRDLFVSSTGVYGEFQGADVDENSPTEPPGFSGRILLEAEELFHRQRPEGIVLRLGGIYGPGRRRLIDTIAAGERPAGDPSAWTNRIHRDDAAGAIEHLLSLPEPDSLYLGVDATPARLGEVCEWLAEQLGTSLPPPSRSAPTRSRHRGGNRRCVSNRLRASGFEFTYPDFRAGFAPEIASGADLGHLDPDSEA